MIHLQTKIFIKTRQTGYGMKLAAQLNRMGMNAVVQSTLKSHSNENYKKVILMDYEDDCISESQLYAQKIVLTDDIEPENYIVYNSGVLYLSKALEIDSICNIILFHISGSTDNSDCEKTVSMLIRKMGISIKVRGYAYLKTAIMCTLEDPELIYSITTSLYEKVAKVHKVDMCRVERAIKNAIDNAYEKTPELFLEFFPCEIGKPNISDVIALIVDSIRMDVF